MSFRCASCTERVGDSETSGDSSLYDHGDGISYSLCEPCWLAEDALIDERGMNDLPEVRARYAKNQPGGYR